MKWQSFLSEVLGEIGYKAILKTPPILAPVVIPRSIIGWVQLSAEKGYEGQIPGVDNSYISLQKKEDGLHGAITVSDGLVVFEKASSFHVAATLSTSLEINLPEISDNLKKKDLSELGRAIDLMLKTQVVNLHKKAVVGRPGPQDPPTAPKAPHGATKASNAPVPMTNLTVGQGQQDQAKQLVDQQGQGESSKLKLTEAESHKECPVCKKKHFKDKKFEGCECLKELSKHVKTEKTPDGYFLVFDRVLNSETLEALVTLLKD